MPNNDLRWQNPVVLDFASRHGYPGDPVAAARAAVHGLLVAMDLGASQAWTTDLGAVSTALGIDPAAHEYAPIDSTARLAESEDGALKIVIGTGERPHDRPGYGRTRFSVAHELGHVLIRSGGGRLPRAERLLAGKTQKEEETLCHLIASEILIPKARLTQYVDAKSEGGAVDGSLVLGASREFRVSRAVAINRFASLRPEGVALYWTMSAHPKAPDGPSKLRVRWAFPQAPVRWGAYVPYHATAKDDRMVPNVPLECYESGQSVTARVEVASFGGLKGTYDVVAIDLRDGGLFGGSAPRRGPFDIVTLLSRPPLDPPRHRGATPPEGEQTLLEGEQLSLFARLG